MRDPELVAELGKTVAAYLNTVKAVGECVAVSCPEVGTPYRDRILRLRGRAAFDATAAAISERYRRGELPRRPESRVAALRRGA